MPDSEDRRARPIGINHVAIEVGDIEEALEFYGALFEFDLRGRTESSAFVDVGDQFLALSETDDDGDVDGTGTETGNRNEAGTVGERDDHRHFGLVVDDPDVVERRLQDLDAGRPSSEGPDFRDPWGNWVQVVAYEEVQFTKAEHVLRGMGLADLDKTDAALAELAEKGMAPE